MLFSEISKQSGTGELDAIADSVEQSHPISFSSFCMCLLYISFIDKPRYPISNFLNLPVAWKKCSALSFKMPRFISLAWRYFRNRYFGNGGFEYKDNKNAWISACLFADLSFFICLSAACFSEMTVSKVKTMELSESRSYSFLGSMHIVFHLQFNLPSSFFFSLCQFLTHPDCSFAAELTITLYNKVWMQKEEGLGVPENKI